MMFPALSGHGVRDLILLLVVELPAKRTQSRLDTYDAVASFAVQKQLIPAEREPELLEMLIAGASFRVALDELRSRESTSTRS